MKPTILIIDDEIQAIKSYQELLGEEFDVYTSTSVSDGLKILKDREIAVVITDMRMPGQDGEDFLEIANIKHRQPIKIILSAYVDKFFDDAFQSRHHVFAVLRKPLRKRKEFLHVIRKAVSEYEWRLGNREENASHYLNADQVLERMGISRPTLYKYLRSGLPSKRIGGRRLFEWQKIRGWVDQHGRKFS